MAENTLKTRIKHPQKTLAQWEASDVILLAGEVAYVDDGRYKVGDGAKTFAQLPWPEVPGHTHSSAEVIKFGTRQYWIDNSNYIPSRGELIAVTDWATDTDGGNIPAIKVGDGLAYAVDLPVVAKDIRNILDTHIADTSHHVSSEDRLAWNNKWRGYILSNSPEELVFTTE